MGPESRKVYHFDGLTYYAENGIIVLHDNRDGTTRHIDPDEFEDRGAAIGDEGARCIYADERLKFERAANEVKQCAAQARAQGNPLDRKVQEYHRRHKTYRKAYMQVPKLGGPKVRRSSGGIILP